MDQQSFSRIIQSATSRFSSSSSSSSSQHEQQSYNDPSPWPSPQAQGCKAPSYKEVLSSAKLLFQTAKPKQQSEDGSNTGKMAGAFGTILEAAAHYGKVDEKGYGNYIHKAGQYLHSYGQKNGGARTKGAAGEIQANEGQYPSFPSQADYPPSFHGGEYPSFPSQQGYPPSFHGAEYPPFPSQQGYPPSFNGGEYPPVPPQHGYAPPYQGVYSNNGYNGSY